MKYMCIKFCFMYSTDSVLCIIREGQCKWPVHLASGNNNKTGIKDKEERCSEQIV